MQNPFFHLVNWVTSAWISSAESHVLTPRSSLMLIPAPLSTRYFTILKRTLTFSVTTCSGVIWWRERKCKLKKLISEEVSAKCILIVNIKHLKLETCSLKAGNLLKQQKFINLELIAHGFINLLHVRMHKRQTQHPYNKVWECNSNWNHCVIYGSMVTLTPLLSLMLTSAPSWTMYSTTLQWPWLAATWRGVCWREKTILANVILELTTAETNCLPSISADCQKIIQGFVIVSEQYN